MDLHDIKEQLNRIEMAILNQKEVLTFDEAVQFTGISKSYMYKLTSARKIPHYKPSGKMVYFNRDELQTWLLQNRVSTHDELEMKAQAYCIKNPIGTTLKSKGKTELNYKIKETISNRSISNQRNKIRNNKIDSKNKVPLFKFGRYKYSRIDECIDLNYLIWTYKNIQLDDFISYAIEYRIEELQSKI